MTDKLVAGQVVVVAKDQTPPKARYQPNEQYLDPAWVEEAVQQDMIAEGWRKVEPLPSVSLDELRETVTDDLEMWLEGIASCLSKGERVNYRLSADVTSAAILQLLAPLIEQAKQEERKRIGQE